jgi:hypothetical protein
VCVAPSRSEIIPPRHAASGGNAERRSGKAAPDHLGIREATGD